MFALHPVNFPEIIYSSFKSSSYINVRDMMAALAYSYPDPINAYFWGIEINKDNCNQVILSFKILDHLF